MLLNTIKGLNTNHTIRYTKKQKYKIEGKLSLKRDYCTLCSTHHCISPIRPSGNKSLNKTKGFMKNRKLYYDDFSLL